jgi:hypothetical protein
VKVWHVPPQTFEGAGVKPVSPENGDDWDLREWFARRGLKLSGGEKAIYDPLRTTLVVCAKSRTLQLVDQMGFGKWTSNYLPQLERVEVDLVEFSAAKVPELGGEIPVEKLRQMAGRSWHIMNRSVVVSPQGMRTVTESTADSRTASSTDNPLTEPNPGEFLQDHEGGTYLELEPWAPSDETVAVNVAYQYRSPGNPTWKWQLTLAVMVHSGTSNLLRLDSEPSEPTKWRALILRVDTIYPTDKVKIHSLRGRHSSAE